MNEEYCIVLTTYADESNGQKIINALLAERLAACVQVMPICSYYPWQGKVNRDDEQLMLIKTKCSLYSQVEATILARHAYETPEILQVPVSGGFSGYLQWLDRECR
ncbi:MAG: divalent-cation tolerance protein CutA [Candidatus Electrothrix sp. YB6]